MKALFQIFTAIVGMTLVQGSIAGELIDATDPEKLVSVIQELGYELGETVNLELINGWNKKALVGRAYLDDDGSPWLEYVVNTYSGVSRENFEDTFDWWEASVDDFEDHIGY